jgi:hypothetical protein
MAAEYRLLDHAFPESRRILGSFLVIKRFARYSKAPNGKPAVENFEILEHCGGLVKLV